MLVVESDVAKEDVAPEDVELVAREDEGIVKSDKEEADEDDD